MLGRLLMLLALVGGGLAAWTYRAQLVALYEQHTQPPPPAQPVPDPATYAVMSGDLEMHRLRLADEYSNAGTEEEQALVLAHARKLLEGALPRMMRCWLGTPWDYNGMARKPGDGKVACGYFVSTVLKDAGFRVERVRLAQQPSQNILGTFLTDEEMSVRVGLDYDRFLGEVLASGPGVYIVGLDSHVAFLVVEGGEIRFIHSSGARPWCVVDESRTEANSLQNSRYRVSGNLTANDEVVKLWLQGSQFKTRSL